jgi:hypothetical protein
LHLATRKRKEIYSKETRRKVAYGNRETKSKEDKSDNNTCKTKEAAAKACNFQHSPSSKGCTKQNLSSKNTYRTPWNTSKGQHWAGHTKPDNRDTPKANTSAQYSTKQAYRLNTSSLNHRNTSSTKEPIQYIQKHPLERTHHI